MSSKPNRLEAVVETVKQRSINETLRLREQDRPVLLEPVLLLRDTEHHGLYPAALQGAVRELRGHRDHPGHAEVAGNDPAPHNLGARLNRLH